MPIAPGAFPDYGRFLTMDNAQLETHYMGVLSQLSSAILEEAQVEQDERRARTDGYIRSISAGNSRTQAEKDASLHATDQSCEVIETRAAVWMLREEKHAVEQTLRLRGKL